MSLPRGQRGYHRQIGIGRTGWPNPPEHQDLALVDESPPISGQQYTLIAVTTPRARLYGVQGEVFWTVQPSPLEFHITADGVAYTASQVNPATGTNYVVFRALDPGDGTNAKFRVTTNLATVQRVAFLIEARELLVTCEITGGTVSRMVAEANWARWP